METFEVADGVKKFTSQFLFVIRFESSNFVLYLPLPPIIRFSVNTYTSKIT